MIEPLPEATQQCAAILRAWPADVVVFDWLFLGAAVAAESAGNARCGAGALPVSIAHFRRTALVQRYEADGRCRGFPT